MNPTLKTMIAEINACRLRIISMIEEFHGIHSRMADVENLFLALVLMPGFQLQMAIKKRKYLDQEYQRIKDNIAWGAVAEAGQIASEVRAVLRQAEIDFAYRESEGTDDDPGSFLKMDQGSEGADLSLAVREQIIKDFKRLVIPRIHSDTSDTPIEMFNRIYDSYRRRDYLLMWAYVIQYRGELGSEPKIRAADQVRIRSWNMEYPDVSRRLEQRVSLLKQEMTLQELKQPEAVKQQLQAQNREIQRAICEESEKILNCRQRLESLVPHDKE